MSYNFLMSISQACKIKWVIAFLNNRMILKFLAIHKFMIEAGKSHEAWLRIIVQVKTEAFIFEFTHVHERR